MTRRRRKLAYAVKDDGPKQEPVTFEIVEALRGDDGRRPPLRRAREEDKDEDGTYHVASFA